MAYSHFVAVFILCKQTENGVQTPKGVVRLFHCLRVGFGIPPSTPFLIEQKTLFKVVAHSFFSLNSCLSKTH